VEQNLQPDLPGARRLLVLGRHAHTAMVMEHIVDQLARRARIAPAAYRRTFYERADARRHLTGLDALQERSRWDRPLEDG
jgi:isoquinoline 1-oxidoreductase beta subunit